MSQPYAIQLKAISKTFAQNSVFQNLTYGFPQQGVVVLTGANGSGKSTLLNMIAGMLPVDQGEICIYGATKQIDWARHVAFVPDHSPAYPFIRGREFLDLIASIRGLQASSYTNLVELFQMHSFLEIRFDAMSFGTAKKFTLISALMTQVPILILDEPTHGLDQAALEVLRVQLLRYSQHALVLMTCHDLHFQEQFSVQSIDIANLKI